MSLGSGTRIGKYIVDRELGHGGFGVIYVAKDTGLDRDVALKVLREEHIARRDLVQRFLQEARAAAKVDHPGIVTMFECGVVDDPRSDASGTVYIAMELLRGETLAARAKRGRIPVAMAVGLCRQAAAALGAAHRAGIVHRDLKPDNLFLCPDRAVFGGERVKLLDFGIAKLAESAWSSGVKTHSMTLLGTPVYMSPEQCKSSAKVDARSDIYTLGCIIFELVCGRPPYDGDSGELIAKHQLAPVPDPRVLAPDLPPALAALLRAMLAKAAEDRPQNMEQVEAQLEAALDLESEGEVTTALHSARPSTRHRSPTARPPRPPASGTIDAPGTLVSPSRELDLERTQVSSSSRKDVHARRAVWYGAGGAVALGVIIAIATSQCGGGSVPAKPAKLDAAVVQAAVPQPDPPAVVPVPVAIDAAVFVVVPDPPPADPPPADPPPAGDTPLQPTPALKAGRHGKHTDTAAPPAPPAIEVDAPACDAEEHRKQGEAATVKGAHAVALAEFEKSLACKSDKHVLALAYMEACASSDATKARKYYALMPATGSYSQATLMQMCNRIGIDPRAK